ncbi:LppM family (lipo)protein [Demequina sp. NBRC 110054]|uniref:LppM family (lipo)protein n=1 Tax=Demequina sp. NBRC 110054 TaxID=1570343 RepID=UPI0009FDC690|nr:hypothetical protein [Demequina sp. NBRC 110054]
MLNRTRRRLGALVLAVAAAASLSGCYSMKSTATFHADDTVDLEATVAFSREFLEESGMTQESLTEQLTGDVEEDEKLAGKVTIEPYETDEWVGASLTATGIDPLDMSTLLASEDDGTGATQTYSHIGGTITLTSTPSSDAEADGSLADLSAEDIAAAGIEIEQRYTFPGPVESTTVGEIDPDDPNTVVVTDFTQAQGYTAWEIVAADAAPSGFFGLDIDLNLTSHPTLVLWGVGLVLGVAFLGVTAYALIGERVLAKR